MAQTQQTPIKTVIDNQQQEPIQSKYFDKSNYILKTMLKPSSIPKYDKQDTMNYDNKRTVNKTKTDDKDKSTIMSIFKMNL